MPLDCPGRHSTETTETNAIFRVFLVTNTRCPILLMSLLNECLYLPSTVCTLLDSLKRIQQTANENPWCKLPRACLYCDCTHVVIHRARSNQAAQTRLMQARVFKHHNVGSQAQVITDARPMAFKYEFYSSETCWLPEPESLFSRACSWAYSHVLVLCLTRFRQWIRTGECTLNFRQKQQIRCLNYNNLIKTNWTTYIMNTWYLYNAALYTLLSCFYYVCMDPTETNTWRGCFVK